MRFRLFFALLISTLLSACALPGGAAPTPQASVPTSQPQATSLPVETTTTAEAATAAPEAAATSTAAEPATSANYERTDCKFDVPQGVDVACGFLTVPEDHTKNDGKTIKLAVAVFKSPSATPKPDPIIYLHGGPGGNALESFGPYFDRVFATYGKDRDFIIYDQRGTGFAEPNLACQEVIDEYYYQLDKTLSSEESTRRANEATLKCHDRLDKQGINFSAYNSVQSAADLDDLRQALGYDQWNLYGISYGTRLALTTMREHPKGIRSVILDSVEPVQESVTSVPAHADRVFSVFFKGCAADATCNTTYPDLENTFYKLVDQLNAKPASGDVTDRQTGKSYKVEINGDSLVGVLFQAMYQTSYIPGMPQAITNAANKGDFSRLLELAYDNVSQNKDLDIGDYYSVTCNEEVPFDSPGAIRNSSSTFPRIKKAFDQSSLVDICNAWNAGKAPAVENQPVKSDIPTLVLAGEYDPITPPDNAKLTASTLPKSFFFEFPGYGHGESIDGDCATAITQAFFDDPTAEPDSSCIANLDGPDWIVPEGPIKLKAFEDTDSGVKGVVPEGWKKTGNVAYVNAAGDAVILQFAAPRDRAATLDLLKQQFKLTADPQAAGEHASPAGNWSLYTLDVQGQPADLALLERNGSTLVVLVATPKARQQELHDMLFIPALDALQPLK